MFCNSENYTPSHWFWFLEVGISVWGFQDNHYCLVFTHLQNYLLQRIQKRRRREDNDKEENTQEEHEEDKANEGEEELMEEEEWEDGGVQSYTGDENEREQVKQQNRLVHVHVSVKCCVLLLFLLSFPDLSRRSWQHVIHCHVPKKFNQLLNHMLMIIHTCDNWRCVQLSACSCTIM